MEKGIEIGSKEEAQSWVVSLALYVLYMCQEYGQVNEARIIIKLSNHIPIIRGCLWDNWKFFHKPIIDDLTNKLNLNIF